MEFSGPPSFPGGARRSAGPSLDIAARAGMDSTVNHRVSGIGLVQSVKINTKPQGAPAFVRTDCYLLRGDSSYCP